MKLGIVILAAGQGTRMKSSLPKVLHSLAGRPLLAHVVETALSLQPEKTVVVYGHGGEKVREAFDHPELFWVEQSEQLGTGHAVQQAMPMLQEMDRILVLYGDVPLIRRESLQSLIDNSGSAVGLMTVNLDDPSGYGRIQRDREGTVQCIVEHKDASEQQLTVCEINTGIMLVDAGRLHHWLQELSPKNAQGEYYLTDIIAMAVRDGIDIHVTQPGDIVEAEGVNDRLQLASLERVLQRWQAEALMHDGVTLMDPARFDLRGSLITGTDVTLDVNVIIEGQVELGNGVSVGANTVLRNVRVADNVRIRENCVIEEAVIGAESIIGPFSRIRPGTELIGGVHVGNFVEIKNSTIGLGSKINHLSYIGDTRMGGGVNIGAGTITCNYDGAYKHQTIIEDHAFIGSNAALVAPVCVGKKATIGAGSVIVKDAPADELTVSRSKQLTIKGWRRPKKET
ncbi:MAG TPA: UDP-N-acetylglucosamine diphosphorylase/glucosamine-1-phosphate N-acetyltransferase [Thiolapillus brandeum]|uniref:Bifunctional protein GlmU n=1 Tax=Thiolapillus brandeum TaxID=1076588 RepID=A0A831K9Z1_9GAMM|nr:UDP-N-acetylglucosamine diphosphorylase/glucosamine-1-phosphate N-acetyltransferase [Thiolapillus brandeum]